MQPEMNDLQAGIAAFQAGDRDTARKHLSAFVEQQPENEQGWYYLAAVESNPTVRKTYLERVLKLNPNNAKAREVLERIRAREGPSAETASAQPADPARSKIRALNPDAQPNAEPKPGLRNPLRISGAPEQITATDLFNEARDLFRAGLMALGQRPEVYASEVDRATWWSFWVVTGAAALISAVVSLFISLLFVVQGGGTLFSLFTVLLTPLLSVPLILAALFAGIYASYRYAQSKGWNVPLVRHAMVAGLVWAPVVSILSLVSFVFRLVGVGSSITSIVALVFAGYVMGEGFSRLYLLTETNDKYALPAITLVVMLIAVFLAGGLLNGLIFSLALPFAIG